MIPFGSGDSLCIRIVKPQNPTAIVCLAIISHVLTAHHSTHVLTSHHSAHVGTTHHSAHVGTTHHSAHVGTTHHSAHVGTTLHSAHVLTSHHSAHVGAAQCYARVLTSHQTSKPRHCPHVGIRAPNRPSSVGTTCTAPTAIITANCL